MLAQFHGKSSAADDYGMKWPSNVVAQAEQPFDGRSANRGPRIPGLKFQANLGDFGMGSDEPLPVAPFLLVQGIEMKHGPQSRFRSAFGHAQNAAPIVAIMQRRRVQEEGVIRHREQIDLKVQQLRQ